MPLKPRPLAHPVVAVCCLVACTLIPSGPTTAKPTPAYRLEPIGLTGPGYQDQNGFTANVVFGMNDLGQAIGRTWTYTIESRPVNTGQAAWLADADSINVIGLYGGDYFRYLNRWQQFQHSEPTAINNTGHAIGYSHHYITGNPGRHAWVADHQSTTRIGLIGPEFTQANGYEYTLAQSINDAGTIIGYTNAYDDATFTGRAAWVANTAGHTTRLGYTTAPYTNPTSGENVNEAVRLNASSQILGYTSRFAPDGTRGNTAWLANPAGQLTRVGPTGPDYLDPTTGFENVTPRHLTDTGFTAGTALRHPASASPSTDGWVQTPTGHTFRVGLTGSTYQGPGGAEATSVAGINNLGQSFGTSTPYQASSGRERGTHAWLADEAGNTTRVGLTGPGYLWNFRGGWEVSSVAAMNDAGQAVGYSTRFFPSNGGRDAWFATLGGTTTRIGLDGDDYKNTSNNFLYSDIYALNQQGLVLGRTRRIIGSANRGHAGFLYDPNTDTSHELLFSVRESDGFGNTYARHLTEDGTVLGTYDLYLTDGSTERRIFAWTLEHGMTDLTDRILNPDDQPWANLFAPVDFNPAGQLLGSLTEAGNINLGFLLTPIPEPSAATLLAVGLLALSRRRRHAPASHPRD